MSRWSFLILSLSASLAACLGCSVPRKVVWLPDSSGFVYTKRDGTLVRYDIQQNKHHTLAKAKTRATIVPGVSPDGKRFAVVDVVATETAAKVTVTIYDTSGKVLATSNTLTWKMKERKGSLTARSPTAGIDWSPDGKHLLVTHTGDDDGWELSVFNVQNHKLEKREGIKQSRSSVLFSEVPLIRPDGKGFLAESAARTGGVMDLHFVEWSGKQHRLKEDESFKEFHNRFIALQSAGKLGQSHLERMRTFWMLPLPQGRWEKQVAVIAIENGEIRIDTEKHTVTFRKNEKSAKHRKTLSADNVYREVTLFGGRFSVRAIGYNPKRDGRDSTVRFQLVDSKTKRKTFLSGHSSGWPGRFLSLSPDGKFVVITIIKPTYASGNSPPLTMKLIDYKGKLLTTFEIK